MRINHLKISNKNLNHKNIWLGPPYLKWSNIHIKFHKKIGFPPILRSQYYNQINNKKEICNYLRYHDKTDKLFYRAKYFHKLLSTNNIQIKINISSHLFPRRHQLNIKWLVKLPDNLPKNMYRVIKNNRNRQNICPKVKEHKKRWEP